MNATADDIIPIFDLRRQYRTLRPEIDAAVARVLESGEFERGDELDGFEQAFASFCGVRYAVGTGSGQGALFLALKACGLGPGDEVITVANTDLSTTASIRHTGASVVWADIDGRTFNIDPACIEAKITSRTRAIVPVHMYGLPADMDPILAIAQRHGLIIIDDAALAAGATYKGRRTGSFGHAAAFSFAAGKVLGAYGDAGAVVTNDPDIAARARLWGSYGERRREERVGSVMLRLPLEHEVEGYHNHLDTLQAAVLKVKLQHLESAIARRREVARQYDLDLAGLDLLTPLVPENCEHVYRNYVVRVQGRERVRRLLAERGIVTGVLYAPPLHLQPVYRDLGVGEGSLPVTEAAGREIMLLPMFPELTMAEVGRVVAALRNAVQ